MPGAPALCQTRGVWQRGGEPVTGPAFEVPDKTTDCTRNLKRLKKKNKEKISQCCQKGHKDQKSRMMMNGDRERNWKCRHKCIFFKSTDNLQQRKAAQWNRIEEAETA